MARPLKDGVDYWNEDCYFYSNNKIRLLRSEFGANGMYMLNYILCEIYKEGYYAVCDQDWCGLVSDGAVCGGSPNFVEELIKGCVRRSFFDKRVFDTFGVITSRGIQKRYIRMLNKRVEIRMIKEYFLLDLNDPNDVPTNEMKAKIVLKSISGTENPINGTNNQVNDSIKTQSKVKESKVKESKVKKSKVCYRIPAINGEFELTQDFYNELTHTYSDTDIDGSLKKMISFLNANPAKKRYVGNTKAYIELWIGTDAERGVHSKQYQGGYEATYDIDSFENLSSAALDEGGF